MTDALPTVIWDKVVDFLSFETSAVFAGVNRDMRKLLKEKRFGCHRCGRWLKAFDEDGQSEEAAELWIWSLDCDGEFYDRHEMFCLCGAIYNFCEKCNNASTFLQHCGCSDSCESLDEYKSKNKTTRIPGTGISPTSIVITKTEFEDYIIRAKPGVPPVLKKYDSDGTEIDEPRVDSDDYTQFYVGDLNRRYAIAEEQIGDKVYTFSLPGPDGGMGTDWYCKKCNSAYGVSDK